MSKTFTIRAYKKMVKPAAVFGSEKWAVSALDVTRLDTGEREILRICGPVVEQGLWRIGTNEKLRELH
jgi:hypothetical protein